MSVQNDQFFWDGYLHWAGVLDHFGDGTGTETGSPLAPTHKTALSSQSGFLGISQLSGFTKPGPDKVETLQPEVYEPIFVQINTPLTEAQRDFLKCALADPSTLDIEEVYPAVGLGFLSDPKINVVENNHPNLIFDSFDVLIGIENAFRCEQPIECFLYRKRATTYEAHHGFDKYFSILDVGPPSIINRAARNAVLQSRTKRSGLTFGAVIDNDIGFLNDAFCVSRENGTKETRFEHIWLQSHRQNIERDDATEPYSVIAGREIDKSKINILLEDFSGEEASAYRVINQDLHLWEAFRDAPLKDTHGTAVAALAYGNDFYSADPDVLDVPLLGVQLPPEAAADTSGAYSESYIVQGVRWLCWRARQLSDDATMIINISYGVLAGPKDGSKFIASQIKREVECAERSGLTVHVVYAFGNGLNNKQVASVRIEGSGGEKTLPKWTIPRNQRLPSHMEIRAVGVADDGKTKILTQVPDHLEFTLTSPSNETLTFSRANAQKVVPPFDTKKSAKVARFYCVEDRSQGLDRPHATGMLQVSIAPTIPLLAHLETPVAEAGDWTLTVKNSASDPVTLIFQIQRGDTAPGFILGGKQSQFEGKYRSVHKDGFTRQELALPLTNDGTNSAYTNALHDRIHVASAGVDFIGSVLPADYSARGADWTKAKTPSNSELEVVDQIFTVGCSVTGTYTGTRTRLSGTSAAAALKSRKLVQS